MLFWEHITNFIDASFLVLIYKAISKTKFDVFVHSKTQKTKENKQWLWKNEISKWQEWTFKISVTLTLSWRRPLSYRIQSTDLRSKSMDWFLYDNGLRHERVKIFNFVISFSKNAQRNFTVSKFPLFCLMRTRIVF